MCQAIDHFKIEGMKSINYTTLGNFIFVLTTPHLKKKKFTILQVLVTIYIRGSNNNEKQRLSYRI